MKYENEEMRIRSIFIKVIGGQVYEMENVGTNNVVLYDAGHGFSGSTARKE